MRNKTKVKKKMSATQMSAAQMNAARIKMCMNFYEKKGWAHSLLCFNFSRYFCKMGKSFVGLNVQKALPKEEFSKKMVYYASDQKY